MTRKEKETLEELFEEIEGLRKEIGDGLGVLNNNIITTETDNNISLWSQILLTANTVASLSLLIGLILVLVTR